MKRRGQQSRKRKPAGRTATARPSRRPAKPRKKVHKPSANSLKADLQNRTRELNDALEQLAAMAEVLRVISSSPGNLKPVFAKILQNAVRICGANFGNMLSWDGEALRTRCDSRRASGLCENSAGQGPFCADPKLGLGGCDRPNTTSRSPTLRPSRHTATN